MSNKRNTVMLFVMLLLILLLLTPMNGVTPKRNAEQRAQDTSKVSIVPSGDQTEQEDRLTVAVRMAPEQYAILQAMNQQYMRENQVVVELTNIYPEDAFKRFAEQGMLGDTADIMLLQSEWVNKFAVSGYLLPVDSYFSGAAASEQLDWIMNQVKWNGYIWGIPKDVDPYILVWNPKLLKDLSMDRLPSDKDGWLNLERHFAKMPNTPYLIGVDLKDGYQTLTLLRRFGSISDAAALLEPLRPHIYTTKDAASLWERMARGEVLAMLSTRSVWEQHQSPEYSIEVLNPARNGKNYWVQSRSFVISAKTRMEKEAKEWIQAMTSSNAQGEVMQESLMLPSLKHMYTYSFVPALPGALRDNLAKMTDLGLKNSSSLDQEINKLQRVFDDFVHAAAPIQSLTLQLEMLESDMSRSVDIHDRNAVVHDRSVEGTSSLDNP